MTGDWVSDIRYQTRQAREAGRPLIVDASSARIRNESGGFAASIYEAMACPKVVFKSPVTSH